MQLSLFDEAAKNCGLSREILRASHFTGEGRGNEKGESQKCDNPLSLLVPEARLELARSQGPLDFESSASTNFTTPA